MAGAAGSPWRTDDQFDALLRWNSDKRYLLELPGLDVEIVPTQIARGSS